MEQLATWVAQGLLFLIAFVANLFSAFAGGGAGLLQLPIFIFLGLPFGIALATHKVATVALGLGATLPNLREGHLQRRLTLYILGFGLPGVILGATTIVFVPGRYAKTALGILTIGIGIYSIARPGLGLKTNDAPQLTSLWLFGGGVLFLIGLLNGSLASGTGLLVTLWLVRWFGLDYKRAIAHTLVLVGVFWNAGGAITLGLVSQIQWDWLPALICGSLIGGYLGARLAIIADNRWIKRAFEIMTLLVGIKLLWG